MSSIFGKDRQFMSEMDLEVVSFVDLPLKPGDNSPETSRRKHAPFGVGEPSATLPNNLPINNTSQPNQSSFQDSLRRGLIDITPQHSRPGSIAMKSNGGPSAIPYSTPTVPQMAAAAFAQSDETYGSSAPHRDQHHFPSLMKDDMDSLDPLGEFVPAPIVPLLPNPPQHQRQQSDTSHQPQQQQQQHPPPIQSNSGMHQKYMSTSVKSLKSIGKELDNAQNFIDAPTFDRHFYQSETLPIRPGFGPTISTKPLFHHTQHSGLVADLTIQESAPLRAGGTFRHDDDDDRHTHISMATSCVSTIPLSTDPSATKTVSALYAMLTIIAGVVVTTRGIMSDVILHEEYNDIFASYMFSMGILSCIYLCASSIYSKRQSHAPIDHHNGSIYINVGIFVFCLGSLTHTALVMAETFQYSNVECMVYVRLGHLALRALFQVAQLFVLLLHAKVCIQGCQGLARFFMAHIIATDFFMWFLLTVKETQESIVANIPRHFHHIRLACERDHKKQFTDLEEESTPILFPMVVAYCVIAGCVVAIMWENVGKNYAIEHREESQEEHDKQLEFQCKDGVLGVMMGCTAVVSSICALVLYILFSNDIHIREYIIAIYQGFNGVWLGLLVLLLPIALCTLKRHRKQDHYHNTLNKPILLVTTCGAFTYCVLNIMAGLLDLITLQTYASIATVGSYGLQAVQTAFQTVYLLDGLRRCPRRKRKRPSKSFVIFFLLVNIALWVTIIFELKENALNPLPEEFYGILNWQIILHFIGPFASLYRFHSVCCLIDVWKFAY